MIEVTDSKGRAQLVNPKEIVWVAEAAAASGYWHGIRSFIKTTDGATLECKESVQEVKERLQLTEQPRAAADAT